MPLADVRPGMQGYAYTIFAGDQIEKFDLVVIGVLDNFLGPRQSIILVQLKGEKVEHTGVVAGMSGSPVYLEGKLAGALSLKLGVFTKEPIGGVTPIRDVMDPLRAKRRRMSPPAATATETVTGKTLPCRIFLFRPKWQRTVCLRALRWNPLKPHWYFRDFPQLPWVPSLRRFRIWDLSRRKAAALRRAAMMRNWWQETWPEWFWCKATRLSIRLAR